MDTLAIETAADGTAGFGVRVYRSLSITFLSVVLAYLVLCTGVWAWQSHLIFEPERQLHNTPADNKFPIDDRCDSAALRERNAAVFARPVDAANANLISFGRL